MGGGGGYWCVDRLDEYRVQQHAIDNVKIKTSNEIFIYIYMAPSKAVLILLVMVQN